ncbi:MAG TPA: clostripain-related cysteine peptidase, partial [Candidatus Wallbacteria bacterium]|nr:clostripain-related cysteine peptidase [Candidatus Wallbacteria bacterium]
EEKIPAAGTPYSFILDRIISQKELEPRRFCFAFVSAWQKYYNQPAVRQGIKATLSAITTAEFPMITEKMDVFLSALREDLALEKHRTIFNGSVLKKVRRYIDGQMVDAFDLGRLVNEEILEEVAEQSSREYLASITNATVKNSAIGDFGKIPTTYNSFGISIFMPQPAPNLQNYSELAFAKTTSWKNFLDFFYGFSLQRNW